VASFIDRHASLAHFIGQSKELVLSSPVASMEELAYAELVVFQRPDQARSGEL
jgi:hypothetical protein